MSCECCDASRETSGLWPHFTPACLWCGARLIQRIGRMPIPAIAARPRQRAVLDDWVAYGHADAELRRLAKLDELPLAPVELIKKKGK